MELWQALILGLVEGLTEYLPVSSTGHLLVAQRLMGIAPTAAANTYAIAIQAGAIVAVFSLYRERVKQIGRGMLGRDVEGRRLLSCVALGFLPAAVLGFVFDGAIEKHLFGPWPIVAAWAAGGILLLALSRWVAKHQGAAIETLGVKSALWIGLAQCVALWPGVSRSLATMLGGLVAGLTLGAAVEFSFLLGLVTLGAATAYKTLHGGRLLLEAYGGLVIGVGFITAWLSALLAVRWMVRWLTCRGFNLFAWWRLGLAMIVSLLLINHWL